MLKRTAVLFLIFGLLLVPATAEAAYDTPEGLAKLISTGSEEYLLLDVRTEAEYRSGHIPTAENIDYRDLNGNPALPEDKEALIILYCRSGNRSGIADRTLRRMGYSNLYDFGGISRWSGPLNSGSAP
jgi:rhodanese-related sulfurtransferase